jgi:hypothetical protein
MLESAAEHYGRQQRLTAAALALVRRGDWRDARRIAEIVAMFQLRAAQDAIDSLEPMLAEQGISVDPVAAVAPATAFAGTAMDGRPLESLFEQASSSAATALMVVTQIQDAARSAAGVGIVTRPRTGYVRMLNPPSCSRCVILAGRFYRWSAGFQRHPGCDCRHIPSRENVAGDLTTDPRAYYEGLDEAGRIKFAGSRANARAIDDGADLNQIVNIYRQQRGGGLGLAQPLSPLEREYGLKFTTAGSTTRSWFTQQQVGLGLRQPERINGLRRRLMPESIYANAENREQALEMLRANGWVVDLEAIGRGRAALEATRRVERAERRRTRREQRREELAAAATAPDIAELRRLVRERRARRSAS